MVKLPVTPIDPDQVFVLQRLHRPHHRPLGQFQSLGNGGNHRPADHGAIGAISQIDQDKTLGCGQVALA
jgi:hypothetical protein